MLPAPPAPRDPAMRSEGEVIPVPFLIFVAVMAAVIVWSFFAPKYKDGEL